MGLIQEGALVFLCVSAAAGLLALFLTWLLRPEGKSIMQTVLLGQGDGAGLEASLQWLSWLRRLGLFQGEVVVWDMGLTPEGWELALRLSLRWPWVTLCPSGRLEEWLKQEL